MYPNISKVCQRSGERNTNIQKGVEKVMRRVSPARYLHNSNYKKEYLVRNRFWYIQKVAILQELSQIAEEAKMIQYIVMRKITYPETLETSTELPL